MLGRLAVLVRWREWFDSKLPMFLVAMLYAALHIRHPGTMQMGQMGALFVLLCLYAAFGYLINDYADRASDLPAGKQRLLATWSELACFSALAGPCLGAAAIAVVSLDRSTTELTIAAFVLAVLYSLPPVRLKERGIPRPWDQQRGRLRIYQHYQSSPFLRRFSMARLSRQANSLAAARAVKSFSLRVKEVLFHQHNF